MVRCQNQFVQRTMTEECETDVIYSRCYRSSWQENKSFLPISVSLFVSKSTEERTKAPRTKQTPARIINSKLVWSHNLFESAFNVSPVSIQQVPNEETVTLPAVASWIQIFVCPALEASKTTTVRQKNRLRSTGTQKKKKIAKSLSSYPQPSQNLPPPAGQLPSAPLNWTADQPTCEDLLRPKLRNYNRHHSDLMGGRG